MVMNLANSIRLQGHKERAGAVLKEEDWSATDDIFNVCVSAVQEEFHKVATYIRRLGKGGGISSEEYKTWPVFPCCGTT